MAKPLLHILNLPSVVLSEPVSIHFLKKQVPITGNNTQNDKAHGTDHELQNNNKYRQQVASHIFADVTKD